MKYTVLFLAANPSGTDRLALDREARSIHVELERSGYRDRFEFKTRWAAELLDLLRELRRLKPTVVHFSGHGGERGLFFQDASGRAQVVSTEALKAMFGAAGASVRLVVLNACYSEPHADALLAHVDCVIGTDGPILDTDARSFAIGFYGGLGEGEPVAVAFAQGRAAISLERRPGGASRDAEEPYPDLPEVDAGPRLKVRPGVDASKLVVVDEYFEIGDALLPTRGLGKFPRTSDAPGQGLSRHPPFPPTSVDSQQRFPRVPPDDPPRVPPDGGPGNNSAPKPVQWSTRILDGSRALAELFVIVGRAYTIETGLDPAPRADALASSTIAPGGLPDRTQVTFEVSCPQPILRGHGEGASEPAARVVHTAIYDATTGHCPPARFGLVPAAHGRVPLTLNVVTDNAVRASTLLTLQAESSEPVPMEVVVASLAGRRVSTPKPIDIAAALAGPPAQLRFELTATNQIVISDGVVNELPRRTSASWSVLITEVINARKELVELSGAYRRDPARRSNLALANAPAVCLQMAKIGARLHRAFFGRPGDRATDLDVQRLARAIADTPSANAAARLQIVAAFQPFPWAVLYDGAYRGKPLTDDPASVDLACFWGHRFRIDRMIMGHAGPARAPTLPTPVRVQMCLNRHLDDEIAAKTLGVRVVDRQRALFEGLPGITVHPRIESADDFIAYLRSERACDLLYMFCHATAAVTRDTLFTYSDKAPDTQAKLIFEPLPAPPVDVRTMQDARTDPLLDRPLVFLNACSSAAGDEMFQSPMLEQFLERWGAIGVLGTDWDVPTVFADAFVRLVLEYFLRRHLPLGEALWLAGRDAFAEGNPFPLIYALYARPDLTAAPRREERTTA